MIPIAHDLKLSCGCEGSELVVWVCEQQLMWPLVPVFSILNKLSEVLHLRSSSYAIYCVRGARAVLAILIKETALFRRVWKKQRVSKANKEVQTHGISAIRRIFVLLISFSSNDLSSRLLKIEQKSTIASFFLKLVQNGFLYRLKRVQIWNSGCVKKKLLPVLDRIPFFYIKRLSSRNCHDKTQINWPLQMSPVAGTNFALGSNVKFKPGFQNPSWKNRTWDLGNRASPPLIWTHWS